MMRDLTIFCAQEPDDVLRAKVKPGISGPEVVINFDSVSDGAPTPAMIALDKQRARELFNWLGIWLHKY